MQDTDGDYGTSIVRYTADPKEMSYIGVKASSSYEGPFQDIEVNSETPLVLETPDFDIHLVVRINGYTGPDGPVKSEYFDNKSRANDQFSIQFVLKFKNDVAGSGLVFGNDFDKPIRDLLPWGFSAAFELFKSTVDPSVDGDVYADKPYLYGPVLTSINYISQQENEDVAFPLKESLDTASSTERQSKFLDSKLREEFVFKKDSIWAFDFVTPYISMSEVIGIKLPGGWTFDVGKYADATSLRYVCRSGSKLVFCVVLSVINAAEEPSTQETDTDRTQGTQEGQEKNDEAIENE